MKPYENCPICHTPMDMETTIVPSQRFSCPTFKSCEFLQTIYNPIHQNIKNFYPLIKETELVHLAFKLNGNTIVIDYTDDQTIITVWHDITPIIMDLPIKFEIDFSNLDALQKKLNLYITFS